MEPENTTPGKGETSTPTHPIFWRLPYLFSGVVYCFFSFRVNVKASSCIWNSSTSLTCREPISKPHICHHPNKSPPAQQLATIHHLPLFHIPPPCVLWPKPRMLGDCPPTFNRESLYSSGYDINQKEVGLFFWVDDSPTI